MFAPAYVGRKSWAKPLLRIAYTTSEFLALTSNLRAEQPAEKLTLCIRARLSAVPYERPKLIGFSR
jgi:hypothetical protein